MARPASIKFTVGGRTVENPFEAIEEFQAPARRLRKELGELTRPFDDISQGLISRFQSRISQGIDPPLGNLARTVRQARGDNPDGPPLVSSGRARRSLGRLRSPTRSKTGGQREVNTLRIGFTGAPYMDFQLTGGTWEVPAFEDPQGRIFIDFESISGTVMSNDEIYSHMTGIPELLASNLVTPIVHPVEVPGRNVFEIKSEDIRFVIDTLKLHLERVINERRG